jgi:hypothetical protein
MTKEQKEAIEELKAKTLRDIQVETAKKWAHRAWAARAMTLAAPTKDKLKWVHDATEYEHEALEHAALSGYTGLIDAVRRIIEAEGPK